MIEVIYDNRKFLAKIWGFLLHGWYPLKVAGADIPTLYP